VLPEAMGRAVVGEVWLPRPEFQYPRSRSRPQLFPRVCVYIDSKGASNLKLPRANQVRPGGDEHCESGEETKCVICDIWLY